MAKKKKKVKKTTSVKKTTPKVPSAKLVLSENQQLCLDKLEDLKKAILAGQTDGFIWIAMPNKNIGWIGNLPPDQVHTPLRALEQIFLNQVVNQSTR